jgi:hypothetical protein
MGIVITRTKALTADSVNAVAHTQTPGAAGNLTLTASPVTLDTQRQVLFTFVADESARTFVVYGTKQGGASIQESVTGTATTAHTLQNFLTVSRISVDHSTAGALQVGTNTVGSTDWQSIDIMRQPVNVGFGVTVTGTVNYTIQTTTQDINNLAAGVAPTAFDLAQFTALTYSTSGGMTTPAAFFRLQINSGTGSCQLDYEQAGP